MVCASRAISSSKGSEGSDLATTRSSVRAALAGRGPDAPLPSGLRRSGWLDRATVAEFRKFSAYLAWKYGGLVDHWTPLNEPMVVATNGYVNVPGAFAGYFPPGVFSYSAVIAALQNLVLANAASYDAIKARDRSDADGDGAAARVGLVQNLVAFTPADPAKAAERAAAGHADYLFNRLFLDGAVKGIVDANANGAVDPGERHPALRNKADFVGVNYYFRGRVTGLVAKDGWRAPFDAVASNGDVVHTYRSLLRDEPRAERPARRLGRMRHSMSLFLVYFGTRCRYPHLAHHNVLFGPRYRELLDDIFEKGVLADDFSLYLHAPTVSDPSLAPPGCEAFYVLAPVPHLGKAAIDWEVVGPRYADRILDYLDARYIPGLRRDLVTRRIFTPLDFARELHAHHGSAFSLEPVLTQSAWFRVHNRDDRIGGLYFVGAGTHPGAGIPGVVNSAKATAGLLLEDLAREAARG